MENKKKFSQLEEEILKNIAQTIPKDTKYFYKELQALFNKEVADKREAKSLKAISLKYKALFQKSPIQWSHELDSAMLNQCATEKKWRNIVKEDPFLAFGIEERVLKLKFKADILRKFRLLFTQESQAKVKEPSYTIFRKIMNEDQLNKFKGDLMSAQQFQCLKKNIKYFKTSTYPENKSKRETRSKQSKQIILKNLHPSTNTKVLFNAIMNFTERLEKRQKGTSKDITKKQRVQPEGKVFKYENEELQKYQNHSLDEIFEGSVSVCDKQEEKYKEYDSKGIMTFLRI